MVLMIWYETLWGQNMSNTSSSAPEPLIQKSNNQSFEIYQNTKFMRRQYMRSSQAESKISVRNVFLLSFERSSIYLESDGK